DEASVNAQLLERAGFIYKNSAGVYSFLPLGLRVLKKIENIIREEMNAIGGQELLMAGLHDKKYLTASGRWDVDVVFKVISGGNPEPVYNMSWTHEELFAEIATKYINSYKDLPFSGYQIQTKYRDEPRPKSGLLRGREFIMKDLYSFHRDQKDLEKFYDIVKQAYFKIFERCGLKSYCTLAAGGDFTASNTHEFQVLAPIGEDTIFFCEKCGYAENKAISKLKNNAKCPKCGGKIKEEKAIEVGNIFPLGEKYSRAFNLKYVDEKGNKKFVVMGSYGIGLGRTMATIVEIFHDDKGIIWPESVAPFKVHLIELKGASAEKIYNDLIKKGVEVLYDDRDVSAGEKFADADLIGIPNRVVVSEKTGDKVELKKRGEDKTKLVYAGEIL
ncbi:MAG: His/Gly/Thr/Pro-type tRNA ligase C-terminal domain-containing protein, partial [Candidatus Parcubacteria bacterium]|nr:His/Gly/Thr/Pro-type tRNA ligase C-terminal domain-containing protein [Candidatus Parcubacteria bacterium]